MSKVQLPVHKNETVTGTVLDLTYQGNGVVKVDHYPIFVPNTLPGEEVTVKVTKVTKNFAWGKLISIEKKSPDRIDDPQLGLPTDGDCAVREPDLPGPTQV